MVLFQQFYIRQFILCKSTPLIFTALQSDDGQTKAFFLHVKI